MNLLLLGKPGAGKGSLCKEFESRGNVLHVSTGDIFRNEIKNQTPLGILADSYISKGNLCPDEVTNEIIKSVLLKNKDKNILFDGYPRTINQAEALNKMMDEIGIKLDYCINMVVDDELVIERLSSRRICRSCGEIYNTRNHNPKVEGVCDLCGGEIYTREDDKASSVKARLDVYNSKTKPLIDFYTNEGKLREFDGRKDPDELYDEIVKTLSSL